MFMLLQCTEEERINWAKSLHKMLEKPEENHSAPGSCADDFIVLNPSTPRDIPVAQRDAEEPTPISEEQLEAASESTVPVPQPGDEDVVFSGLVRTLFARYDLDQSGTLNTSEELEQLTIRLGFALVSEGIITQDKLGRTEINAVLAEVEPLSDENAWTVTQFEAWFRRAVGKNL